jgi:hypothetical protein
LHELKASDPDVALWIAIATARTKAIKRGEVPPEFMKLVPLEPPAAIKQVGFMERRRAKAAAKAAREAAKKALPEAQGAPSAAEATPLALYPRNSH